LEDVKPSHVGYSSLEASHRAGLCDVPLLRGRRSREILARSILRKKSRVNPIANSFDMVRRTGPLAPGIAFVTGGARGLGNAIAVSFARDGAKGVVIVDVNDEETMNAGKKAVEDEGAECICIRADVTKEEDVQNAVKQAVEKFGRIDYAA